MGSVMGMVAAAALTIAPHANRQAVRYDPVADFAPVSGAYLSSTYLAVNATLAGAHAGRAGRLCEGAAGGATRSSTVRPATPRCRT